MRADNCEAACRWPRKSKPVAKVLPVMNIDCASEILPTSATISIKKPSRFDINAEDACCNARRSNMPCMF